MIKYHGKYIFIENRLQSIHKWGPGRIYTVQEKSHAKTLASSSIRSQNKFGIDKFGCPIDMEYIREYM